jgi:hypothetical protein
MPDVRSEKNRGFGAAVFSYLSNGHPGIAACLRHGIGGQAAKWKAGEEKNPHNSDQIHQKHRKINARLWWLGG